MIAALLAFGLVTASLQRPAQPSPGDARATITVVDQTGAVIPNAVVTLVNADDPKIAPAPVKTNDQGIATIAGLPAGRYSIQAEFPGFETHQLKDVRLKSGDNKHVVVLTIQGLQDSVTVSRDKQEAASDRKATFGTALTREQIDALSDDPDEMAQQLQDMAGGDAVLRVDSFEGSRLPPKAQIKSIHITRDAFAAENHYAGGLFIDIVTQPGIGPLRTNFNARLRDGSMSGAPPAGFAPTKGPERTQSYGSNFGGSLIKEKASFSLSVNGTNQFSTPFNHYTMPDGTLNTSLAARQPSDNVFVFGLFDYAITKDQTLRVSYNNFHFVNKNQGVGGLDLPERAFSADENQHQVRLQEVGPLGRRFFINSRVSLNWDTSGTSSLTNAPTIIVVGQFNAGGQQQSGTTDSKSIDLQSDLDYVRGRNSVRTGLQLQGAAYRSNASSNYLGTYTFADMPSYLAGIPENYTIRLGDPNVSYSNLQAAFYVQDDIRVRKDLTLSPGVRYEAQTHLDDYNNFGPRFGVTYAPGKAGRTSLRASVGMFYDWLSTGTYQQTLVVNGTRERELNIPNPPYPSPDGAAGVSAPSNRYMLDPSLQAQQYFRTSVGFDRAVTRMLRVNGTYAHTTGINLMRGDNLNAPTVANGPRPDPNFVNVVEVVDDAKSRQDQVNLGFQINFNPPPGAPGVAGPILIGPAAAGSQRWNWRKVNVFANVALGRSMNDTDGPFAMPATGNIADDWGPASNDVRERGNVSIGSSQLKNFNANININMASATPYTLQTGVDSNGDLDFNDRPAGVGRNTARGDGIFMVNGFFAYIWTFGKPTQLPPGIGITGINGNFAVTQVQQNAAGRYRLALQVQAQNLTNHANYAGFTGVITSPQFGKPSTFLFTRRIDVGLNLSF